MIEPFKYLIQPVAIEREDGRIVREMPAEVITVYNAEQAMEAVTQFEATLAQMVAESNGAKKSKVKA